MRTKALVLASIFLLAACGGGGGDPTVGGQPAEGTGGGRACTDLSTGAEARLVMVDNAFEPPCLIVSTTQTIALPNEGGALHNFQVEEQDIDIDVPPGEQAQTEPIGDVMEAGTYRFVCKYHPGMDGELQVR